MYSKRYIWLAILLVGVAFGANAAKRKFVQNPVNHFITISLGGGEANTVSKFVIPESKDLIGAAGNFGFGYELRKNSFFFGLGAQAEITYTGQRLGDFVEPFQRIDFEHDPHVYSYRYSDFTDIQRTLQLGVPVYFGYYFNQYVYGMLGAKFDYSFLMLHAAVTHLTTDGTYPRFAEPITDRPRYGFYPDDIYGYAGAAIGVMKVGPTLEVGAKLPIYTASRRFGMRVGLYAAYLFPLEFVNNIPLVDYTRVNQKPESLNKEDLKKNIVFNSPLNSPYQEKPAQYLEIGLHITFLFNVTPVHKLCNCDTDNGVHPVRSAGRPNGLIMK